MQKLEKCVQEKFVRVYDYDTLCCEAFVGLFKLRIKFS